MATVENRIGRSANTFNCYQITQNVCFVEWCVPCCGEDSPANGKIKLTRHIRVVTDPVISTIDAALDHSQFIGAAI